MNDRRDFIKNAFLALGGLSLPGFVPPLLGAQTTPLSGTAKPMRFIFMQRSNGLFPKVCVPPTLSTAEQEKEKRNEAFEVDLDKHDLPAWMAPLEAHKKNLTILQGISGKMCSNSHHGMSSSLGVYKDNYQPESIKWATVDFELAKLFPSPLEHIELACFAQIGGHLDGIDKGFSAPAAQTRNYAFGSPKVAVEEIFKSVAADKAGQTQYELERKVLQFVAGYETELGQHLKGIEGRKVTDYAGSVEAIRERNRKIDQMADVVRKHVPQLDSKYLSDKLNTFDRQMGHAEVMLSALVSGLTNVVSFTMDELGHDYTGVTGLEGEIVNLHDIGHNKSIGGIVSTEIRRLTEVHHMEVMNKIATRLKSIPEGNGTMFDNTMIFYLPSTGEAHHSYGFEFPFIILAGANCKLNLPRRYMRLPYWGKEGHKTLGNLYTTILNAYGNPIKHYGDLDVGLKIEQTGPIKQFLA